MGRPGFTSTNRSVELLKVNGLAGMNQSFA